LRYSLSGINQVTAVWAGILGIRSREVRNVKEVFADCGVKHIFYHGADSRRIFGNRIDRGCADTYPHAGRAGIADAAGNADGNTIADTDSITEPDQSVGPGAYADGESNGSHAEPGAVTDTEQVRCGRINYDLKSRAY
jgi:hypothetical protein